MLFVASRMLFVADLLSVRHCHSHAYWRSHAILHSLTLCQTMFSMLNYGDPYNPYYHAMDMGFAVSFFSQRTYELIREQNWLLVFAVAVACLYSIKRTCPNEQHKTLIDAAIHVVACVDLHIYLYQG